MAKNVSVVITDDIDGSDNAQTVSFGLNGVSYEIDLAENNREMLEKALAPFIQAGRRSSRNGSRRPAGRPRSSARVDRADVRTWAKAAGLKVSERGRISADIMQQYEAAH